MGYSKVLDVLSFFHTFSCLIAISLISINEGCVTLNEFGLERRKAIFHTVLCL